MRRLLVGLTVTLLGAPPVWGQPISCEGFPAESLSRAECGHVQQQLVKERFKRGIDPMTGYLVMDPHEAWANASALEGQDVIVPGLAQRKTLGGGEATFGTGAGDEITVVGILPSVMLTKRGNVFLLRGLGVGQGANPYGSTVTRPKFLYLGQP